MRPLIWCAVLIVPLGLATGAAPPPVPSPLFQSGPVAFSAAEAARGQRAYLEHCARCHGPHLTDGQFGPPMKGPAFRALWQTQSAQDLRTAMVQRMPPNAPGSLGGNLYTDIEAYLLRENGGVPGNVRLAVASAGQAGAQPQVPASEERGVASTRVGNLDATYRAVMASHQGLLDHQSRVSDAMLRAPPEGDWLMWRGGYATQSYSPLHQINRDSVRRLEVAWTLALPPSANEGAPLIHDGVLYAESGNTVEAINAVDGSILWRYIRPLPETLHSGTEARMRGLALYEDQLYAPTADGHIVALDMRSGSLRWDHAVVAPALGVKAGLFDGAYFHISGGPLVVNGKVIVGVSLGINTGGGDFIMGLDAHTGQEQWRFNTIAHAGEPGADSWNGAPASQRFGSGVWSIGSFDPQLNLLYFGTGNTYDVGTLLIPRAGKHLSNNDALYTDSTVALNPDTGKLAWYYQHMNRDVWDLDWAFEQTVVTVAIQGQPKKLVISGGKAAIFDAVAAADGKYAFSKDLGLQNLVGAIEPGTGRKIIRPEFEPQADRTDLICPTATGARSWPTTAFDPGSETLFVPLVDNYCMQYSWYRRSGAQIAAGGQDMRLRSLPKPVNDGNFGRIEAIDLKTQRVIWSHRQRAPIASSLLVTAGGLLFSGARDRQFRAFDAVTGKVLWQTGLNASPSSSPATYSVEGVQYLVVIAGGGGAFDAGGRSLTPEIIDPPAGTTLWVFRLSGTAAH